MMKHSSDKSKRSTRYKQQLLTEVEEFLERLSIPLRYEKGNFHGGLCSINNTTIFILNKNLSLDQKLKVFKRELRHLDLEQLYLRPNLREFIEASEENKRNHDNGKARISKLL